MKNQLIKFYPFPIILVILLVFSSCATTQREKKIPADRLFAQGETYFLKGKYEKAEAAFKKLLTDHPYSRLRPKALLGLADSLYKQDRFEEARPQYERFIQLYPVDKNVDKAIFYKGMSFFTQIENPDRDQTNTHYALQNFEELVNNYPESKYKQEAEEKIVFCQNRLAENIFLIGKFYFRLGAYQSAINRFQELLEKHPGKVFGAEATYYLAEAYFREDSQEKAKKTFQRLITRFPESKFVPQAKRKLEQ